MKALTGGPQLTRIAGSALRRVIFLECAEPQLGQECSNNDGQDIP